MNNFTNKKNIGPCQNNQLLHTKD